MGGEHLEPSVEYRGTVSEGEGRLGHVGETIRMTNPTI